MKKQAKNSIIYTFGMILTTLVSFISTLVLTRVLSQQVYAQYGLLTTFITASVTVVSLGMDTAYTRFFYESQYTPIQLLMKCIKIPLILAIVFSMLLLEPSHHLLKYIFEINVDSALAFLIVGYLLFALFSKFTQLTARMGEFAFNYIFSNFIAKSGFIVGILFSSVFAQNTTLHWVVLSFAIASLCALSINISTLFKAKKLVGNTASVVTTKEMLSYGIPLMITNVMMLVVPLIEKIVVRGLAGWKILSIYTAASVFYTVTAIMKSAIDNIWQPIVFRYYSNKKFFQPFLHDFGLLITGITVIGLGFCILLRRWLVLILDKSYFEVYLIAPAIMFSACYEIYTMIYAIGLNTEKKTVHILISPIIQIIVSLSLCFLLIPRLGLIGIGIASMISVVVSKTYRIFMGLSMYSTGKNEWKIAILWSSSVFFSIYVMFFKTLLSDCIVFIVLTSLSILVLNKEGVAIIKTRGQMFIPQKFVRGNRK